MKWLLRNFWLKLVAFALGLLVWVHVATEKTYNYEFDLPVTEITLRDGLALSAQPPESLRVSVSASGKQLLRRRWRAEGLRINASQFSAGRFSINLSTQNTSLAHPTTDVVLEEIITPATARLEIDVESSVELPIAASIEAEADEGFAIGQQLVLEPESATLIGPRNQLQGIASIATETRRLSSLRHSVTVTLPLAPPAGYGFRVEPDSVAVTITVSPVKTRVFGDIPVLVFHAPTGTLPRTEPARLVAEVTGPPDDVDQLDGNSLSLSVDYRERDSSGYATVKFDCPPGFRLRSLSSDSVLIIDFPDVDPGN
jgi:hypothetical protein